MSERQALLDTALTPMVKGRRAGEMCSGHAALHAHIAQKLTGMMHPEAHKALREVLDHSHSIVAPKGQPRVKKPPASPNEEHVQAAISAYHHARDNLSTTPYEGIHEHLASLHGMSAPSVHEAVRRVGFRPGRSKQGSIDKFHSVLKGLKETQERTAKIR